MFIFQAELRRNIGLLQAEVQKKDGMLQYVSCSPRIALSLNFVMRCDKWWGNRSANSETRVL